MKVLSSLTFLFLIIISLLLAPETLTQPPGAITEGDQLQDQPENSAEFSKVARSQTEVAVGHHKRK